MKFDNLAETINAITARHSKPLRMYMSIKDMEEFTKYLETYLDVKQIEENGGEPKYMGIPLSERKIVPYGDVIVIDSNMHIHVIKLESNNNG